MGIIGFGYDLVKHVQACYIMSMHSRRGCEKNKNIRDNDASDHAGLDLGGTGGSAPVTVMVARTVYRLVDGIYGRGNLVVDRWINRSRKLSITGECLLAGTSKFLETALAVCFFTNRPVTIRGMPRRRR